MFTGVQIRAVRASLGMTVEQFAGVVGVHQATLYRWEAKAAKVVRLDPLQTRLMFAVCDVLNRQRPEEAAAWGAELAADLVIGGGLFALYRLLTVVYGPPAAGLACASEYGGKSRSAKRRCSSAAT